MERWPEWRARAACRNAKVDMVPAADQVRRAKAVCSVCPVRIKCLLQAEKLTLEGGTAAAQGVWGGLTERERATMAGLGRLPAPCARCGQECVPINMATDRCSVCHPAARISYDDYRLMAEQMIRDGRSYQEISDRLRLPVITVKTACRKWKIKPGKRSRSRSLRDLKPCGTVAAKYRHHRKERRTGNPADGFRNCPQCRLVPWDKGVSKAAAA